VKIARSENAKRFAAVLFVAFVIACGGKTPNLADTAVLRFTPRVADPGSPQTVTAEAGSGQVVVRATLAAPDPCRTLDADLDHTDSELTLRVSIRPAGAGACVLVIGRFAYDAVIESVPRGRFGLRVVHTYPSTGWPTETVLTQMIEVR
jgi:hypothetical protein